MTDRFRARPHRQSALMVAIFASVEIRDAPGRSVPLERAEVVCVKAAKSRLRPSDRTLSDQYAQNNANRQQRNENATCGNGKESWRERSEGIHVPCDCGHETDPKCQRKDDRFKNCTHAGTKHYPCNDASETDVADMLDNRDQPCGMSFGLWKAKQYPEPHVDCQPRSHDADDDRHNVDGDCVHPAPPNGGLQWPDARQCHEPERPTAF